MTTPLLAHGSFTLERKWPASPSRVFNAWADPALKAQWFTGPPGWTALRRSLDFRTGGLEVLEGRLSDSGSTTLYEARFHLIELDRRLVYGEPLSATDPQYKRPRLLRSPAASQRT